MWVPGSRARRWCSGCDRRPRGLSASLWMCWRSCRRRSANSWSTELRMRGLTKQEIQLLQWLAHHGTAKEIAVRLKIRVPAAQSRIRRVREKLESQGEGESEIL